MTYKTPAEQQMELLKKMKEEQRHQKPKKRPAMSKGASAGDPGQTKPSLRRASSVKRERTLPLSEAAWQRFVQNGLQKGRYKRNKATGDWAIELLLALGPELSLLPPDAKRELFDKIHEWASLRGMQKPD